MATYSVPSVSLQAPSKVIVPSSVPVIESQLPPLLPPPGLRLRIFLQQPLCIRLCWLPPMMMLLPGRVSASAGICLRLPCTLEGFSLHFTGSTLGPCLLAATPSQCEEYLWFMLHIGTINGSRPHKVQKDETEKMYKQEGGLFALLS